MAARAGYGRGTEPQKVRILCQGSHEYLLATSRLGVIEKLTAQVTRESKKR
jgi:hypothetical protein